MKSENLNFMESSGPLQACNGTALPLTVSEAEFAVIFRWDKKEKGVFSLDL